MDFGSAAFVYVSGLLPPARVPQSTFRTLVTSWPLAVLAAGRLIAVKLFQYPEHTSEYGVHWNFFATLLCLRIVVLLIRQLRRKLHIASSSVTAAVVTAASLLIGYQCALQHGLEGYILNAPRGTSFLADNRYAHERIL
jgi:glucosaminylphosphatidylinositol acyltransferase